MAIGDILVDVQAVAKHYGEGETSAKLTCRCVQVR